MNYATLLLLSALVALTCWFVWRWYAIERGRAAAHRHPTLADAAIGFITNFFDTLGIGSFAPTTAIFKFRRRIPDEQIPGTLNVGHALPTVTEALIFIAA